MPGDGHRPAAACAISSIAAAMPMPRAGACSMGYCRTSPAPDKWLNDRFASPIVSGGQYYEDHFNPANTFPFSYAWSTDHLTGRRDAILKRPETDPLVIHTQTGTEYWHAEVPWCTPTRRATTCRSPTRCVSFAGPARSISPTRNTSRPRVLPASRTSPTSCPRRCFSVPWPMRWTAGRPRARSRPPAASPPAPTAPWSAMPNGRASSPPFPAR